MNVSVIIPTHNRQSTIVRALESVFAQTHPVYEVIVVNDGSKDDTVDALNPFMDRIVYLENESACGAQQARNRGLEVATGDAIAFLDSDDVWHREKIRLQVDAAKATKTGEYCVTCGYTQFGVSGGEDFIPPVRIGLQSVLVHNIIGPTSNILISRKLVDRIGPFDPEMKSCQDWELFVRALDHVTIAGVQKILTFQDTGSGFRISANRAKVISGHRTLFQRARKTRQFKALPVLRRLEIIARQNIALARRSVAHRFAASG